MQALLQPRAELLRFSESRCSPSTTCSTTSASVCCPPTRRLSHGHSQHRLSAAKHVVRAAAAAPAKVDIDSWVQDSRRSREQWLEESALGALKTAVEAFERPAFPCALIAGDVVILNLLHRLDYLESGRVPIIFIDTFHLFPETHALMHRLEEKYNFKASVFQAAGFTNVAEFKKAHGSDLFIRDIEEYDRICKVEPFQRSLQDLDVDVMINGRRRDHGFERAHLEVFEGGSPVKANPLAWWEFKDCMDYLKRHGLERHPLHDQGYPSIGDVQSTVPVPVEKWYEYAGERSGRFQGLQNPDGSVKTECGIHVADDVKG
ncbi:adenine nucleotide alpha hydrolases-like protein [Coccomyxa subellipsoidea C-169]|uniref:Adenine nucleotide alpha hydrolases-like protein n=1 Tax=Coccomyxa subellipsoidea (strain C-169) TaxID=574566 RepID=I0Z8A6_COCSC|nr:adenine nucleotide alpha hydrolases-like protein [Coccomyxa subellipsoidea C-169]EIE26875.1 adenine nucleotide alpha hydrolases-like protein [Coccomyxa subellipsoidea C-169]|eukprot:XP_005651419.1 adenine nucleotide alpha hydrolases-like protein [Coccomyxa subellipsoidea C-169]